MVGVGEDGSTAVGGITVVNVWSVVKYFLVLPSDVKGFSGVVCWSVEASTEVTTASNVVLREGSVS